MSTNHIFLRNIGKLLAVWTIIVLGMTNGWAVMQSPTSAQLAVTPSPAMAGQTVTLTMTITGTNPAAPPTGVVTFQEGLNVVLGSVPLTNGVAILDTRFSTTGIHGVTATYAGDSNNGGTSMTTWFTITAAATTTQLVSSTNPARPGQTVSLSATVSGVNPTGTITFRNGNTLLGTALLTAGTASITQSFNTVGNYTLTASYSGDTNNQASASSPFTLAVSIEPQVYYIHTDHLDTPRTITDTSGNVVWQWDNTDPFGANAPNENPSGVGQFSFNLRFAGQYFDREMGLNYNLNRDYSPPLGRYIESDPIGLRGGLNTYSYVNGNPVNATDPTGEFAVIGGIIGGLGNLGYQLYQNGGNLNCVNWWQVGAWTLTGSGAGILGRAGMSGIANFISNSRSFSSISRAYWGARGGAGGMSLDHWAISQAAGRSGIVPQSLVNGGWNLLEMPTTWNTWLGFAPNWGGTQAALANAARLGIQAGVPGVAAGSSYAGYLVGTNAHQSQCGCQ